MTIEQYGFSPEMLLENTAGIPARVTAVYRDRYQLISQWGEGWGRLKGVSYYGGTEAFPVTGDFVLMEYIPDGDSRILQTLPRKTFFSRLNPLTRQTEQGIAANFDLVFLVQALNQNFNLNRLERYLTLAWQSGAQPVIVLTKADLTDRWAEYEAAASAIAPGVPIYTVSVQTGFGMEQLTGSLRSGQTIVLLGSSGVGKSSLVNALAGEERMAVGDIRLEDGRGRHTTTHRQLMMLPSGVMVIDTPGMRELGMWDVTEGLGEAFSDVEQFLGRCRFRDCSHRTEPGCAVRAAIEAGELSADRWEHYLSLQHEARYSDDKTAFLRQKQQRNKGIAKAVRQKKKDQRKMGGKPL